MAFLESPESYPHRPTEVRAIQTHISWVFIASPFVFKVKKPLNLGFLDFSTLQKRRYYCRREIELNRRLCPEVYLDSVPIYEAGAGFSFKPSGDVVEYAVQMRELPHGWFLSELLKKNLVGEKEINRVISTLHRFYQAETPTDEIEQRLKARNENTAEASDARVEDFQKLTAAYEPPSELGPHLIRVSTTTSAADAVKTILLRLAERQVVGTDFRPVR